MAVEETGTDFVPLTPVMPDEHDIEAPRQALAEAQRTLLVVRELLPLGDVALSDPQAALRKAEALVAERQAAVDEVMRKLLYQPG